MICVAAVDMLGVCGFDTSLLYTFFLSFRLVQVIGVIDVVFFFFLPFFLLLPLQNADRGLDRGVSDPSPFFLGPWDGHCQSLGALFPVKTIPVNEWRLIRMESGDI